MTIFGMDGLEDQPDFNMFPQHDDLDISDKVAVLKAVVDSLVHEFVDIEYHHQTYTSVFHT